VSRETHRDQPRSSVPPTSSPFGLPGLGRGRAYAFRGDPSRGAAREAPTAPHATSPADRPTKLSGPARFWDGGRVRIALVAAFALSLIAHWYVAPWNLLPPSSGLEFKDVNDPLSIPVDLIGDDTPPPPESAPEPAKTADLPPSTTKDPTAAGAKDAGAKPREVDAGLNLAAFEDAGGGGDGGDVRTDAGDGDAGAADDKGLVAMADGGAPGSNGPRDPESMFGMTKAVNAGVQNVVLGVNIQLIRKHPVGSRMGPILQAIPQWKDFLKGAQSPVDPIRDTDWILIYGPSLIHTDKDAVLVRYTASDEMVDQTIASIAKSYDKGGAFDAGVPGVKASLGWADNAQRVFLRPQSKLLVIVPPSHAREAARTYKTQAPRGPSPREAMRLVVRNPTNQISIPGLKFSASLKEIRLWIMPKADGGADVYAEGDCTDEAAAVDSADRLTELLKRQNSLGVRFATRGLLNKAVVVAEGSKITLHVEATPEQLEAVLQLAGAAVNANIAPPTQGPSPSPSPSKPHLE
jgi:hypothetical protein